MISNFLEKKLGFSVRVRRNLFALGLVNLIFITSLSAQVEVEPVSEEERAALYAEIQAEMEVENQAAMKAAMEAENQAAMSAENESDMHADFVPYFIGADDQSGPTLEFGSRLREFLQNRDEILNFVKEAQETLNKFDIAPSFDDMILGGVFSKEEVAEIYELQDLEDKMFQYIELVSKSIYAQDEFSDENQELIKKLYDVQATAYEGLEQFKLDGKIRWLQMSPEKRAKVRAQIDSSKKHLSQLREENFDQIEDQSVILKLLEQEKEDRFQGVGISYSILKEESPMLEEEASSYESADFR